MAVEKDQVRPHDAIRLLVDPIEAANRGSGAAFRDRVELANLVRRGGCSSGRLFSCIGWCAFLQSPPVTAWLPNSAPFLDFTHPALLVLSSNGCGLTSGSVRYLQNVAFVTRPINGGRIRQCPAAAPERTELGKQIERLRIGPRLSEQRLLDVAFCGGSRRGNSELDEAVARGLELDHAFFDLWRRVRAGEL